MKKRIFLSAVILGLSIGAFAQQDNRPTASDSTVISRDTTEAPVDGYSTPVDGYVVKSDIEDREVIPYAPIRQTDVAFSKRVWREIDLREKMNQAFASPKSRLMDILVKAIQSGELVAYDPTPTENDPTGDSFKNILPLDQVMARLGGDSVLVEQYNENNEVISSQYESRPFSGDNVIKFRIKEDWVFDKQRSVFEPRIIGIAPLITPQIPGSEIAPIAGESDPFAAASDTGTDSSDPFAPQPETSAADSTSSDTDASIALPIDGEVATTGIEVDATPAFWIYFPQARHVLVNKEVVNRNNDATGLSYDDVFIKRLFSSYIVKQSNTEDLRIKDYIKDDMDRLFESERIKKSLMDYEQDLWSY